MGKIVDTGHWDEAQVEITAGSIVVEPGGEFTKIVIGRPDWNHIVLKSGSKAKICIVLFPGDDADITLAVDLVGERADLNLSAVYLCGDSENIVFQTDVRHHSGGCVSVQEINGVAAGKSKVGFYGKISVAPDAQKTEAYQTNHNIILSTEAKVDTKPQLEIYADDVKCSHGATVGSLNEDEQFYMRSRGIPESEAKVLQIISFIAPVLNNIDDETLRGEILDKIEKSIRSIV